MMSYITDKAVCKFILDKNLWNTMGEAYDNPRHNIKYDHTVRKKIELNILQKIYPDHLPKER